MKSEVPRLRLHAFDRSFLLTRHPTSLTSRACFPKNKPWCECARCSRALSLSKKSHHPTPIATSAQHASMLRAEVRESSLQRTCMFSRTERHSPEHGLMQYAAYESHDSQRTPPALWLRHSCDDPEAERSVVESKQDTVHALRACVSAQPSVAGRRRACGTGAADKGRYPMGLRLASTVSITRSRVVSPTH